MTGARVALAMLEAQAPGRDDMHYGGYKTSGIGRQNGIEGFEQYLETKIMGWRAE